MISINKVLSDVKKSDIARNILSVSGGNLISQVIAIAFIPILARIYDATAFGLLSIFISYAGIMASVSTLKYELAISLPKSEEEASIITTISIFASFAISLVYLLIIIFLLNKISANIKLQTQILFLLPVTTISIAIFASNQQFNMRLGRFKYTSYMAIFLSATNILFAVLFSFQFKRNGLILGYVISYFMSSVLMTWPVFYNLTHNLKFKFISEYIRAIKDYSSFPKVMIFTNLLTIASQQGLPILLSFFFITSDVGFFSMANRVVMLPTIILGSAFSSVFRFHFSAIHNQNVNLRPVLIKLIKKLSIIGIPVFIMISALSPIVFPLLLGKEWTISGRYASILCIVAFSHFINLSISNIYIVLQKQFYYFVMQFILLICIVFSVYYGQKYFNSLNAVIVLLSISFLIYSLLNICTSYILTNPKYKFND